MTDPHAETRDALDQLDDLAEAAVSLLTGVQRDELDHYGGMPYDEKED